MGGVAFDLPSDSLYVHGDARYVAVLVAPHLGVDLFRKSGLPAALEQKAKKRKLTRREVDLRVVEAYGLSLGVERQSAAGDRSLPGLAHDSGTTQMGADPGGEYAR